MPSTSARKHHPDRPEADHARTADHSVGEDQLITDTAARTRAAIDAGVQAIAASVIYAGIVADGIPVHPQTLRLALAAKTIRNGSFWCPMRWR